MKQLAERYHKNQTRKGPGNIPYIVHPQAVVETLLGWGEAPDALSIAVGWGHDLLEDTTVSEREIIEASSREVLDCIKELTHAGDVSKEEYLNTLASRGSRNAVLVKAADRICNSRDRVELNGKLYAYQYLHSADCLEPVLAELARNDKSAANALQMWKALDEELRSAARLDAIRGCLIGGAAGDALGAPVEFISAAMMVSKYGRPVDDYLEFGDGTGAITDDTQMTLFTAEGILRAEVRGRERGICDPPSVVRCAYLRWLQTQGGQPPVPPSWLEGGWLIREKALFKERAPGLTCLSALARDEYPARNDSKGCGTVMRMAPAGLFYEPEDAYYYGSRFSAITHGHPTGITAGGALAMLIAYLLQGKPLTESLDLTEAHLSKFPDTAETLNAIRQARSADRIAQLGRGWVAEEALAIGIYCAIHWQWDFAGGVCAAVNIDGDSDSTGAVAGNILGVMNGEKAIPEKWRQNLREYSIVSQVADDLHRRFEGCPDGYVTQDWWDLYPGA